MSIGREVADAYISVHGDLSDFRKDLNKANDSLKDWAEEGAQKFKDAWGERMKSDWSKQWNSLVDSMYSGTKLDFNKMITNFDLTDMDAANEKIKEMVGTMQDLGKISKKRAKEMLAGIDKEIKALQKQQLLEKNMAEDQAMWDKAHLQMMAQLADARDKAAKTMEEAIRENERWARSFDGLTKNANIAELESDFRKVTEAMRTTDFSGFAKGFDTFAELRRRISEVTAAMHEQRRMSDENVQAAIDGANAYIDAEEAKAKATREALDEARRLREEQERFKRSLDGMIETVDKMHMEKNFHDLAYAISTTDWSHMARGTENMEALRIKTMQTAEQMRDLGRITDDQFDWIGRRIRLVAQNQAEYNLSFDDGAKKVRNFRGAIDAATNTFGKMFRLTKGFREHLGGFAGINVFGDMIREGLDFIHNLDRIALSAAMTTTKLATMASIGGSGLLSLVTIAGDLMATLGGLAAIAPSFLIGAGIGIGVLVAALKDTKTVLADLKPAFAKLQDDISADFWREAAGPIRDLVKTLMPILDNPSGTSTARSLGKVFAALATSIKNVPTEMISTMFDRMNNAIEILKDAMAPLVNAFTTLGMAGSLYFERFATWLVDLSLQFNNFIQDAAADGRLLGWIDAMIVGFQNIGRAIDGVFGIFNALDSAASAAGFGGLATFASNLQGIAAAMQSAGAQTTMIQLFSGMLILVEKIGAALGNLGQPLASIMPTINLALSAIGGAVAQVIGYIGEIMANPNVQAGITNFTNGIAAAVDALAPAITPFADSLGNVMGLLGLILVNVAKIVAAFTVQLSPVLDQMSKQFETLVAPLGDAVLNFITAITPVAQAINDSLTGPIVSAIRDQIIPGFNSLVTTLSPIAAQMVTALGPVLEALMPLIPIIFELATTIGTLLGQAIIVVAPFFVVLVNAIMPIVTAIQALVNMIAPYLIPAIQQIVTALTPVMEVIGQVVGVIMSVLVPVLGILIIGVINNVVGAIHGFSEVFMAVVGIITALITGFGAFFTKLFQGDIGGALNALGTMFSDIWNNIMKLVGGALEFLWNAVQLMFIGKMISGIRTGLSSIGTFFKSTWDDIVRGVQTAFSNMQAGVSSGINAITNFFRSGWNGMVNILRSAWNDMVSGVSTGVNNVMGWVQGIPGKISGALSGLGNLLVNAGRVIIDGLLSGLKAAWGGVTSFVGGIAQWIADHKGPISYDKTLLVPAGKAIMGGLESSLKNSFGGVMGFVENIADTISNAVVDAFAHSKMYLAGADAAMGLADGLLANKSAVLDALGNITPDTTLGAKITGAGTGVGTPTPPASKIVNIEAGAIALQTNTQNPRTSADIVLDELVNIIT